VIIGIADQFHLSAAARAIEAGKHVLAEKPPGVSVESTQKGEPVTVADVTGAI
jgi:predicted dehydrogenase